MVMKGKKGQEAGFQFTTIMKIIIALVFFVVIGLVIWFNRYSISDLLSGLFSNMRGGSGGPS